VEHERAAPSFPARRSSDLQNPAGPMDDRFDFQLVSGEMLDGEGMSIIPGSYRAFGNNGTHSLNGAITTGTGASAAVLTALRNNRDRKSTRLNSSHVKTSYA